MVIKMSTFVMGQPFYGSNADGAVDYTNPYLARSTDYYRNPYTVYSAATSETDRRLVRVFSVHFSLLNS